MGKVSLFNDMIKQTAKDGKISSAEYEILIEKGKEVGLEKETVELLIKMELENSSDTGDVEDFETSNYSNQNNEIEQLEENIEDEDLVFKSAITRGGNILTPDIIIINDTSVTYKKRNKYLINVDSITIPISKISSIKLDTSLWGTDIIIQSYGAGEIIAKDFTKSDAKEIRKIIQKKQ